MESGQEPGRGESSQQRQMVTVAPEAPEREAPGTMAQENSVTHMKELPEPAREADAELAVILKQIEGYFNKKPTRLDLEALNFSLRHLFSYVDFLYRQVLPDLNRYTRSDHAEETREKELLQHQKIWLQLQSINRTLDRMAPICHLLSDVIECLLDTLDNEELWLRTIDEEETRQLEQVKNPGRNLPMRKPPRSRPNLNAIEPERWEQAVAALMDRLLIWQEQHHKLVPFEEQFSVPSPLGCHLDEIDAAFAMLLDSAGAIYGDILPNFRLISPEDREEISALLFDLMQQSDQMLAQFEATLEPLTRLIRHFAVVGENN